LIITNSIVGEALLSKESTANKLGANNL
jgi:hypothetical protein